MSGAPADCIQYNLFPTTVMTFEHDNASLDEALASHFLTHPRYARTDQAERSDSLNLMDLVGESEAFARLQAKFTDALEEYCRRTGWKGDFDLAMQMSPNFAPARHYVPSHNHVAHIAAVYYVQTPVFNDRPLVETDATLDRADDGMSVDRRVWAGPGGRPQVVLYTIRGGGHVWPGGPKGGRRGATRDVSANAALLDFFEAWF